MKLRIVHQNQENRDGDEQVMKKGTVEMGQMEEPQLAISMEDEFVKEDSPPLDPCPISAYDPMIVSGKRKRKPKEIVDEVSPVIRRKRKPTASKCKDGTLESGKTSLSKGNGEHSSPIQVKSPTMVRAEEVQSSLSNDQPNFLKVLVRSHVASCFWMGLPVPFCKLHLPMEDTMVILENETSEEFVIKYIAHKTGLSAGWRKFVAGNKLLEGDVLIFQLIEPCRLKVYIIRANDLNEVDGALSLLILDSQTKLSDAEGTMDAHTKKKRHPKSLPLTVVQKKKEEEAPLAIRPEEPSGNDSDEVASEVLEGPKFSGPSIHFTEVKNFEEFHISVSGVCIDSEIPEEIRRKYYELCCTRDSFLHDSLLPGLYCKLAAGMIVEIVSIADSVRGCKVTTPRKEFEVWEKSLRSFELLGMNIGFLRARVRQLLRMAYDSEEALDTRRYWDAKMEWSRTEDEIHNLEAKLVELKELSMKYDSDIEDLKVKAEGYEVMFQEKANASW